jgi:hypothetical protein
LVFPRPGADYVTPGKNKWFKKASRLKNGLQNGLRLIHGLQMDISRRFYDLQMPLERAVVSDTASASKKCPCAVTYTEYVPRGL